MNIRRQIKALGPGLLFAGAAVGVSHLVQSTRAGAAYGFDLVWILVLSMVIKYPFFQYGPRYVAATGKSLIEGYRIIGKWAVIMFAVLTIITMFAIQAAITTVTAGLVANIFNIETNNTFLCTILLIIVLLILTAGRFRWLDRIMKAVIILLTLSTIVAVISAAVSGFHPDPGLSKDFDWLVPADIFFVIAFVGWMPSPIDVSVWHSLWAVEKNKNLGFSVSIRESLTDFNIGYIGTGLLALGFLSLGALAIYGTGTELSPAGSVFADQFIKLYTSSLGKWAYPLIAIAALTTMLSTTITCMDAYPRVLEPLTQLILPRLSGYTANTQILYRFWIIILTAGSITLIGYLTATMRFMVDMATTVSFITAPVLAILNYFVITHKHIPLEARPGRVLRIYSWLGMIFLSLFSLVFILWRYIL